MTRSGLNSSFFDWLKNFNPKKAENNSKENDETQFFSTEEKDSNETVNSEMESVVIDPNQSKIPYSFEPEPEAEPEVEVEPEVNLETDISSVRTSPTTTERTMTPLRRSDNEDEDDKG